YTANLGVGAKGVRIGVVTDLMTGLSDDVANGFRHALDTLKSLGASYDEVSMPSIAMAGVVNGTITWAEALEYHETWMRERPQDYGTDVRRLLEIGMMTTGVAYVRAQRARAKMLAEALDALESHDVLVAPGSAITAPKIGGARILDDAPAEYDLVRDILRFTAPFDCTGQPAIAIPTGVGADGLPVSMQIIGRPFDEATVLRVAAAYEASRPALPLPKV
ncbi:MAG TPA: amidase family protein, partial [Candidatus Binataceae bacterium]|nr:amidase family protein [Candidatus Binataceae bacterium]